MPFQCAFAPSFFLSAPMLSPTFSPTRFGSADTKTSTECGCSWSQITPNLLCQLLNLFLKLYFLHFHTWWQPKRSERFGRSVGGIIALLLICRSNPRISWLIDRFHVRTCSFGSGFLPKEKSPFIQIGSPTNTGSYYLPFAAY